MWCLFFLAWLMQRDEIRAIELAVCSTKVHCRSSAPSLFDVCVKKKENEQKKNTNKHTNKGVEEEATVFLVRIFQFSALKLTPLNAWFYFSYFLNWWNTQSRGQCHCSASDVFFLLLLSFWGFSLPLLVGPRHLCLSKRECTWYLGTVLCTVVKTVTSLTLLTPHCTDAVVIYWTTHGPWGKKSEKHLLKQLEEDVEEPAVSWAVAEVFKRMPVTETCTVKSSFEPPKTNNCQCKDSSVFWSYDYNALSLRRGALLTLDKWAPLVFNGCLCCILSLCCHSIYELALMSWAPAKMQFLHRI